MSNCASARSALLITSSLLLGAASVFGQTTSAKPATHPATKVHRRVPPHAAPCAAPLPPPTVPAGLPPAEGAVKVQAVFALRYVDMVVGAGAEAVAGKMVSLHYTGWLASDGTKFDSSFDHPDKQPIQLPLGGGRVIPGWDQGIVGMKQGGKRRLFIPYPLAYGANGRPPRIPAKSDLIFDVELVEVSDGPPPAQQSPMLSQPPVRMRPPAPQAPATPPSATTPATPAAAPKPASPPTTPQ